MAKLDLEEMMARAHAADCDEMVLVGVNSATGTYVVASNQIGTAQAMMLVQLAARVILDGEMSNKITETVN